MQGQRLQVQSELSSYLILAGELKARYRDIDDETLQDTLEGETGLLEAMELVVRSSLDDAALVEALKSRLEQLSARLERFRTRVEKKRQLVRWALLQAGIERLAAEDFSVSLRKGPDKVEVRDEGYIPQNYLVPQPPRVDKKSLLDALRAGVLIPGAVLVPGELALQVRVS